MKIALVILLLTVSTAFAQERTLGLQEAIDHGLQYNLALKASLQETLAQKSLRKATLDLPKTEVSLLFGQYNSYARNDNNVTVTQSIPVAALGSSGKVAQAMASSAEFNQAATADQVVYQIRTTYQQLAYTYHQRQLLLEQDSIFEKFLRASSARFKTGETNALERSAAEVQLQKSKIRLKENQSAAVVLRSKLRALLNLDHLPDIRDRSMAPALLTYVPDSSISQNPMLHYSQQQVNVAEAERKRELARSAPDLLLGFFTQTLIDAVNPETGRVAGSGERFTGFQIGVALPLWFVSHKGRVDASKYQVKAAENLFSNRKLELESTFEQALEAFRQNRDKLDHFQQSVLPAAELMLTQSQASFREGEISYHEFLVTLRAATDVKEMHLGALNDYHHSIILLEYLSGQQPYTTNR
jgi:heavy metal efflux system protein